MDSKLIDESEVLLDIKDLVVHYVLEDETVVAVNGVSLSLKKGQTLGLVGETGAGKTSTALAILNLVQTPPGVIKSGSIMVCGNDMLNIPPKKIEKVRGKDVSMIFQDPMTALNPVMTVGDQIAESIRYHEDLSQSESLKKAEELLELVGIPAARAVEYPHQFSGGMKQRVVIAIALACNPKILLADEPTSALDVTIQAQVLSMMVELKDKLGMARALAVEPEFIVCDEPVSALDVSIQAQILNLLKKLQRDRGLAFIFITHDLAVVKHFSDRILVMYLGMIVENAPADELYENPMHPYTRALLAAILVPEVGANQELIQLRGELSTPIDPPDECRFAPRCNYYCAECDKGRPPLLEVSPGHWVACHRIKPR